MSSDSVEGRRFDDDLPPWERFVERRVGDRRTPGRRASGPRANGRRASDPRVGVPRMPQHTIVRDQVDRVLDAWAPLTLVVAPPGMGKSTAVTSWVRRKVPRDQALAWIRLSPGDEPAGVWRAVTDRLGIKVDETGDARAALDAALLDGAVTLLVLDDLDLAAPGFSAQVEDLVGRHDNLHAIGIGRTPPSSDIEHASGEMRRVGFDELQLDHRAAMELLRRSGIGLDEEVLRPLLREIGGWPTALSRAARLLGRGAVPGRSAAQVVEETRARLRAVLAEELRHQFAPETVEFAVRCTYLAWIDEAGARRINDDADPADHLAALTTAGVLRQVWNGTTLVHVVRERFVAPLRSVESSWGVRERERVIVSMVEEARAAGRWPEAFRQALELERADHLTELFETAWVAVSYDTRLMSRVLDRIPEEHFRTSPTAAMARRAYLQWSDRDRPPGRIDLDPRSVIGDLPPTPVGRALRRGLDVAVLRTNGRIAEAMAQIPDLVRALVAVERSEEDLGRSLLAAGWFQAAFTTLLSEDAEKSERFFREVLRWSPHDPSHLLEQAAVDGLALIAVRLGKPAAAAEQLATPPTVPQAPVFERLRVIGDLARFWIATERLDDVQAAHWLERLERRPFDEMWCYILEAVATHELLWGDPSTVLATIETYRAEHPGSFGRGSRAARVLLRIECDVRLALGHGNLAQRLLDDAPADQSWVALRRARLAMLEGRHDDVLLIQLGEDAPPRTRTALAVVQAAAHLEVAGPARARVSLDRAARLLRRHETWTAVTALPLMHRAALLDSDELGPLLRELGSAIPVVHPERVEIVTLHQREQVVLDCLLRGRTVEQAAAELFVSPNTVKTQIKSVYRKLGVTTRKAALLRARELGLDLV